MLTECQHSILRTYADAVICDRNPRNCRGICGDIDDNLLCIRINGIFHQLLYDRCRPLNHLACCDMVDGFLIENMNSSHYFFSISVFSSVMSIKACMGVISFGFTSLSRSSTADGSVSAGAESKSSICV